MGRSQLPIAAVLFLLLPITTELTFCKASESDFQMLFEICNYLEITPAEFFEAQNQSPDIVHRISKELYKYSPETL